MFAGRGIALPGFGVTVLVVAGAFALGVGAGWATGFVPGLVKAEPSVSPSATPVPSIVPTADPVLPSMAPITRLLSQDDRDAGVTTTKVKTRAEGTISVVPGVGNAASDAGDVRWVSIAVEDGVVADAAAFKAYVISTLNDNRGWGTGHTVQFVSTDGVADYRIVLASPYTAAVLCPDTHVTKQAGSVTEASPSPSPSPTVSPSPAAAVDSPWTCEDDGVIVISSYDWTAGFPAFGDDYAGSRAYLVNHQIGHLLGRDDVACAGGPADIMVVQEAVLPEGCVANPWPNPDAPATFVDPSAAPSPAPAGATA
ncbi:MAG: DUF3152 domain-containing protein [Demequinaceae bacterium]|nr:DUF3152 domain-containing protein [Demequinaceae bacterium]